MQTAWQIAQVPYPQGGGFHMPGFATHYDPWGVGEFSPEQELQMLQGQAEILEDELDGIKKRIGELEKGGETSGKDSS
jgi:hypothetical protein